MAEEFYQLPESPVYNAETIRKIRTLIRSGPAPLLIP